MEDCKDLPNSLVQHCIDCLISKKSLYIYGEWGAGKTTLAFALINQVMKNLNGSFWPRYITARQLDNSLLKACKSDCGDEFELSKWSECELLFIDDIGKIKSTDRFKTQLFEILNKRYENRMMTIVTSNSNPEQSMDLFDGAVISRMMDKRVWSIVKFPQRDLRKLQVESF